MSVAFLGLLAVLAVSGCTQEAAESDPASFYRGKTVTILSGHSPGGNYDAAARVVAKHLGRFLPGNPGVIVQNMPGAGSLVAMNHLYNNAKRDGTMIGMGADQIHLLPLLGAKNAQFDAREVSFIGALSDRETPVVFVRSDAPATTFEEVLKTEVTLGTAGLDFSAMYPVLLNAMLGTKFKSIPGYVGGPDILLAIERGEVDGRAGYAWTALKLEKKEWIDKNFITIMLQLGVKADPELKDVPAAIDYAKNEEDRQVMEMLFGTNEFAHQFVAPPGLPERRLAVLRQAFKDMMHDPAFLKDADAMLFENPEYRSWEAIAEFHRKAYAMPPSVIARASSFVKGML